MVDVTVATSSLKPHTRVPLGCSGVALVCQGPGDWMLPGQLAMANPRTISLYAALRAAWSRTRVNVADAGPPGSSFARTPSLPWHLALRLVRSQRERIQGAEGEAVGPRRQDLQIAPAASWVHLIG